MSILPELFDNLFKQILVDLLLAPADLPNLDLHSIVIGKFQLAELGTDMLCWEMLPILRVNKLDQIEVNTLIGRRYVSDLTASVHTRDLV